MLIFRIFLFISLFIVLICDGVDSLNIDKFNKNSKIVSNTTLNNNSSKASPRITPYKKWQISRVTEKRYEIVNLLWRKTKIFGDVETISQSTKRKVLPKRKRAHNSPELMPSEKLTLSLPYLRKSSSTPSFIEFHYLDISDKKEFQSPNNESLAKYKDRPRPVINSPFFVFHVQYETCKSASATPKPLLAIKNNFTKFLAYLTTSPRKLVTEDTANHLELETCPLTTLPPTTMDSSSIYYKSYYDKQEDEPIRGTTMYDKIKFFELYDSDTPTPRSKLKLTTRPVFMQNINKKQKGFLDDIDFLAEMQSTNKSRFVKKHINKDSSDYIYTMFRQLSKEQLITTTTTRNIYDINHSQKLSRPAAWSDYPFVAVYIYDPSQVRCDAAALSPHWLLAAASCLCTRYKDTYYEDSQSAYVAYCTDNWRNPERIAYVKRSFIHPRFDGGDYIKRHLFNIGLIEIVNSMAETCNGWAPISLISHQFDANAYGMVGVAVGWGLDRYNASHPVQYSLVMYENSVYSDFCPGQSGISELTKHKNKINDVYCLSLPNYSDGNNDEAHGGMLLIGGKLIALYLQEERRPTGEQFALYSGVWRHIPWLLDTAREPEEFVTFPMDF